MTLPRHHRPRGRPRRTALIDDLLLALGAVAIVEGLVLALAPARLRDILALIERLDIEQLRLIGLLAATAGVGLVWLARL